jgi:hypothetical protein
MTATKKGERQNIPMIGFPKWRRSFGRASPIRAEERRINRRSLILSSLIRTGCRICLEESSGREFPIDDPLRIAYFEYCTEGLE